MREGGSQVVEAAGPGAAESSGPLRPEQPTLHCPCLRLGLNFPPSPDSSGPTMWPPPTEPMGLHQAYALAWGTQNLSGAQGSPGLLCQGCCPAALKGVGGRRGPVPCLSSGRPELTGHWAVGGGGCGEGPDGGGRLGGIHHLLSPWREGFLCRDREGLEEWPLGHGLPKAPIARPSLLLG